MLIERSVDRLAGRGVGRDRLLRLLEESHRMQVREAERIEVRATMNRLIDDPVKRRFAQVQTGEDAESCRRSLSVIAEHIRQELADEKAGR